MSPFIFSGADSICALVLVAAVLTDLIDRVVLQVAVSADGSTSSARSLFLGGSALLGRLRLRCWCSRYSRSLASGF